VGDTGDDVISALEELLANARRCAEVTANRRPPRQVASPGADVTRAFEHIFLESPEIGSDMDDSEPLNARVQPGEDSFVQWERREATPGEPRANDGPPMGAAETLPDLSRVLLLVDRQKRRQAARLYALNNNVTLLPGHIHFDVCLSAAIQCMPLLLIWFASVHGIRHRSCCCPCLDVLLTSWIRLPSSIQYGQSHCGVQANNQGGEGPRAVCRPASPRPSHPGAICTFPIQVCAPPISRGCL
jgi:hypothetical protein